MGEVFLDLLTVGAKQGLVLIGGVKALIWDAKGVKGVKALTDGAKVVAGGVKALILAKGVKALTVSMGEWELLLL